MRSIGGAIERWKGLRKTKEGVTKTSLGGKSVGRVAKNETGGVEKERSWHNFGRVVGQFGED